MFEHVLTGLQCNVTVANIWNTEPDKLDVVRCKANSCYPGDGKAVWTHLPGFVYTCKHFAVKEKWRVRFQAPALAYANGPVAQVLMLIWLPPHLLLLCLLPTHLLLLSRPGQPVHLHRPRQALENGHTVSLSPCYAFQVARLCVSHQSGWV